MNVRLSAFTTFYDFILFYDFTCYEARNVENTSTPLLSIISDQCRFFVSKLFVSISSMQQAHYTQFGMIHGVVQVDDGEESKVVMRGVKERLICK